MDSLATAPGVVATPGKYYCGADDVMAYISHRSLLHLEKTVYNMRAISMEHSF